MKSFIDKVRDTQGSEYLIAFVVYLLLLYAVDIKAWFADVGFDQVLGVGLAIGASIFISRHLPGIKDKESGGFDPTNKYFFLYLFLTIFLSNLH